MIREALSAKFTLFAFLSICGVMLLLCSTAPAASASAPAAASQDDLLRLRKYKPLYFIGAYDGRLDKRDSSLQPWEVQFQLSFKMPIAAIPFAKGKFAFGYTQVAYWQLFNIDHSAPFRETNYSPEFMASFEQEPDALGMKRVRTTIGVLHESNGRDLPGSRSWNRIYGEWKFDWEQVTLGVKPWYRIPERHKSSPTDVRGDDNPDIERYLGYGELTAEYRGKAFTILLTGRNNLRSQNHGSIQLDMAIPTKNDFQLYLRVFDGYGESLIDYDKYNSRIGFGVLIGELP